MALVKLIGLTGVVEDSLKNAGVVTAEDLVAYCARVSNPKNQTNTDTAAKLIAYLRKHKHWSPFEMVNLVFEVETTRDIARQILRHRSFSFQEFSQRYADPKDIGVGPVFKELRMQDVKNRQSSIDNAIDAGMTDAEWAKLAGNWGYIQDCVYKAAMDGYRFAIDHGIAKEQARALLPEGLTPSRLYINGTLRSWLHFCEVRTGLDTQKEHRLIALEAQDIILALFKSLA